MLHGVAYSRPEDTLGCSHTVLPADTTCYPGNFKAIYRQMNLADSGILRFGFYPVTINSYMKMYSGNASALATAQNVFNYPGRINGLVPASLCTQGGGCLLNRTCAVPGTYTSVTFGADVGWTPNASFMLDTTRTVHYSPATSEDMGDILAQVPPGGGQVVSSTDYFSCKDNLVIIPGYTPCIYPNTINDTATKAVYRHSDRGKG